MKLVATFVILVGTASAVFATIAPVPEIDANSAVAAIALLTGGLLVIRGRRKR